MAKQKLRRKNMIKKIPRQMGGSRRDGGGSTEDERIVPSADDEDQTCK